MRLLGIRWDCVRLLRTNEIVISVTQPQKNESQSIASCLNTKHRFGGGSQGLQHSSECAEGILDGQSRICIKTMAACDYQL